MNSQKYLALLIMLMGITTFNGCGLFGTDDEEEDLELMKLACVNEMTGKSAQTGTQAEKSMKLALRDINSNGGCVGKQFELDIRDSKSDDAESELLGKEFIDEGFDWILAGQRSSAVLKIIALAKPAGVVVTSGGSSAPNLTDSTKSKMWFRFTAINDVVSEVLADVIKDDGVKKLGILAIKSSASQGFANLIQKLTTSKGIFAARIDYPDTVTKIKDYDYTLLWDSLYAAGVDGVVLACVQEDGAALLNAWDKQNNPLKLYLPDSYFNATVVEHIGKEKAEGIKSASNGRYGKGWDYFEAEYKAANNEDPGIRTAENYDQVMVVALAMVAANSVKSADWRHEMRNVSNPPGEPIYPGEWEKAVDLLEAGSPINYEGASGKVDLDDYADVKAPVEIKKFQNGEIVTDKFIE